MVKDIGQSPKNVSKTWRLSTWRKKLQPSDSNLSPWRNNELYGNNNQGWVASSPRQAPQQHLTAQQRGEASDDPYPSALASSWQRRWTMTTCLHLLGCLKCLQQQRISSRQRGNLWGFFLSERRKSDQWTAELLYKRHALSKAYSTQNLRGGEHLGIHLQSTHIMCTLSVREGMSVVALILHCHGDTLLDTCGSDSGTGFRQVMWTI